MKQGLNDIDSLIVRYLENEATYEEIAKINMWVNFSNENKQYFIRMAKVWEQSHIYRQDEEYCEKHFARFKQILFKRKIRRISYGVSAAVAIALIVLVIHFFSSNSADTLIYEASMDQKKELVLPDGSVVWLNKNSCIRYPENFISQRKVYLEGEAYFDVVENKNTPFEVETTDLVINVLGTQFLVTDYGEEGVAEAVLESGAIRLATQKTGESFLLQPGQMVSYDKAESKIHLENVDTRNFTDWINNRLVFDNTLLKDAFIQLEKWYGIRIVCDNESILQTPVSFTVDNESKEEIFSTLQVVVPFVWVFESNKGVNNPIIAIYPVDHVSD